MPQQEQSPRDGRKDRESVQQAGRAFELPTFVLAAGLERLEEFFDHPTRSIAVDREGDCCRGIDWKAREKKPLDGRLPRRWFLFGYVDDVDADRSRCSFPALVGTRQFDGDCSDAQARDAESPG